MPSGSKHKGLPDPLLDKLRSLIARGSFGAVFDIDGTLSPIAPTPQAAHVDHEMRVMLRQLTHALPLVAVISGRDAAKAQSMVGVEGLVYEGNYGLERCDGKCITDLALASGYAPLIKHALHEARLRLRLQGLLFEDKRVTASIHYRGCADRAAARSAVLNCLQPVASKAGLRLTEGRFVVEIRPPIDVDKGTALADLVRDYHLRGVVFVGDDCSDVDAFHTIRNLRDSGRADGAAIGVASPEMPQEIPECADFLIDGVPGVRRLISWLTEEISQ
jgi:trehalose 6-phosphate phosphatase